VRPCFVSNAVLIRFLQASIPKQYLELKGQPIATYSMQMFAAMPQVACLHAAAC
jgi:2-C-methyl-D-erythritol 4-phosphate cytidylyltransferase